ncbi:MAG: DUF6680 family protein [Terricaulis silvestris]
MIGETFLIALALLLGPALGAAGAIAYLRWDRAYQRRVAIFHGMLRLRRTWLAPEWVGGLNLAPVEFAAYPEVISAIETLHARYGDPAWQHPDAERRRRAVLDTETAACELLQRMAEALKIPMVGADLRTRPVAPYGWVTDDVQRRTTGEMLAQVLNGARTLRVETVAPAQTPRYAPPPRSNGAASNGFFDPARVDTLQPHDAK